MEKEASASIDDLQAWNLGYELYYTVQNKKKPQQEFQSLQIFPFLSSITNMHKLIAQNLNGIFLFWFFIKLQNQICTSVFQDWIPMLEISSIKYLLQS